MNTVISVEKPASAIYLLLLNKKKGYRMNQNRLCIFIIIATLFTVHGQNSWMIVSPGDKVKANVQLADLGGQADYPSGKLRLYYSVSAGGPSAYAEVIPPSPMGLVRSDRNFVDSLKFVSEGTQRTIDSTYTMITGKRSICRNYCNEKILTFETPDGASLELVLRAYDDGFAFRYRFPGAGAASLTIKSEATGFRVPQGSTGWLLPYNTYSTSEIYSPAYEDCWRRNVIAGTPVGSSSCKPVDGTWCFPALFRTPGGMWALLFESDVTASYCGSHLSAASQLVYRIAFPNANEANNLGAPTPSWTLPWTMPWRMVITGTSPGTILESTLATDLASPSEISDVSWIKPGRSSWSWWSANNSPSSYTALTPFVDLAKQMTWEYSLVDAGWQTMTGGTLQSLFSYANSKNIGLFIWYNSGGPNNSITAYGPRDSLYDSTTRIREFQKLRTLGAKGVKIDFFISDKQKTVQYYLDIFRDAARYNIMVNIHGCTVPRGWQRTWPNLITAEAVRGAEQYIWSADDPAKFPWQNTMMPFTRNTVSSMDWTPVSFTNNTGSTHLTTYGHELALSVIFESGVQHFADRVTGYQTSTISAAAQTFLQNVPVAWDDTRFLQGYPGSWVVLSRRKGNDWYAAGIAGDTAKTMTLSFSFLRAAPASYQLNLITDGTSATSFSQRTDTVSSADSITVNVPARGGWVAKLTDLNPTAIRQPTAAIRNIASNHPEFVLCTGRSLVLPAGFAPGKTTVSVYDLTGKLLEKSLIRTGTIDIHKNFRLPQAVYIVRLDPDISK
jgi:alpha-glucosidase